MNLSKALTGLDNFVSNLDKVEKTRSDVLRDEMNGNIVDTVSAFDTGKWETGISIEGGAWVIVDQYSSKAEAIKGHKNYVEQVRNGKTDFDDIDLWGIDE